MILHIAESMDEIGYLKGRLLRQQYSCTCQIGEVSVFSDIFAQTVNIYDEKLTRPRQYASTLRVEAGMYLIPRNIACWTGCSKKQYFATLANSFSQCLCKLNQGLKLFE
jgi:hypothetical protein